MPANSMAPKDPIRVARKLHEQMGELDKRKKALGKQLAAALQDAATRLNMPIRRIAKETGLPVTTVHRMVHGEG